MSEAGPSPEGMSRSELEEEVRDLREELDELAVKFEAMSTRIGNVQELIIGDRNPVDDGIDERASVFDELDDLSSAVGHHGEQLNAISDVGQEKPSEHEKVAAIAAFAMQKADGNQSKVLVDPGEIKGCTGVSGRYGYKLVDRVGNNEEYEWATPRDATAVTTGSGTKRKKKALKVDCDKLRESSTDPDGLNWFNNDPAGRGR